MDIKQCGTEVPGKQQSQQQSQQHCFSMRRCVMCHVCMDVSTVDIPYLPS